MTSVERSQRYPALLEVPSKEVHPLGSATEFVVGRSQDVDLPVLDTSVSRRHFRIRRRGKAVVVEPLTETNPLLCDGRRVSGEFPLVHGTRLRAGTVEFVYLTGEVDVKRSFILCRQGTMRPSSNRRALCQRKRLPRTPPSRLATRPSSAATRIVRACACRTRWCHGFTRR